MTRNNPVNPPVYENVLNRQFRSQAAYTDGRDNNEPETSNLLSQQTNYGSVPAPRNLIPQQSSCSVPTPRSKIDRDPFPLLLFGIFSLFIVSVTLMTIAALYFLPPQDHGRIRRQWEAEERTHQVMRDAWNSERQAMVVERGTWEKERLDHILEREAMAAERAVEREQWEKERTNQENRQHQEEKEKRALIVWQDLKASSQCLRYGTREYSATLTQVPFGMDPLKECWKKSIDIHGRQLFPSRCDTQGMCGTVVGHWIVDFNEASCVTWWRRYNNKGCVERGIHRYESVLENLQEGDDWHVMCATTPGRVRGKNFDGPSSCASWRSGINAIWLVEDGHCH